MLLMECVMILVVVSPVVALLRSVRAAPLTTCHFRLAGMAIAGQTLQS